VIRYTNAAPSNADAEDAPAGEPAIELLMPAPHAVFGAALADQTSSSRATYVYLHGVCGVTTHGCAHFTGGAGWLVCPQAETRCPGGGALWAGSTETKVATIDRALGAARAKWPDSAKFPVVLVGFSQGAYVAIEAARAEPGRYAGLVLVGANTRAWLGELTASQTPKVALASGAWDMMAPAMRDTVPRLGARKVAARYESLGKVGHTYVSEEGTDEVLSSLLKWVASEEPQKS
jgi:pimeloyl-ACP methyl ester carboxylesterase